MASTISSSTLQKIQKQMMTTSQQRVAAPTKTTKAPYFPVTHLASNLMYLKTKTKCMKARTVKI